MNQRALIDAFVLIEALVLGRDEGVAHVRGDLAERYPNAALVRLEDFRKALTLSIHHQRGAGQFQAFEPGVIGKVGKRLVIEVDHRPDIDRRARNRLVLAELPVGGMQVLDVDPLEGGVAAGNRLWIVHGGGDEVVDVEIFDVEGLAHLRTARAQE
jgi:hypothetical protein